MVDDEQLLPKIRPELAELRSEPVPLTPGCLRSASNAVHGSRSATTALAFCGLLLVVNSRDAKREFSEIK